MNKQFQVKIYSQSGEYVKTLSPRLLKSKIMFSSKVNNGQGELRLSLNLPIDGDWEGDYIAFGNVIRVYAIDPVFHKTPVLIYTGFISRWTSAFSAASGDTVDVVCLGLASFLSYIYYRDGAAVPTVSVSNTDPSTMMADIITYANTKYPWFTSGDNNTLVGTTESYDFVEITALSSLKRAFELGGGDRYWFIDQNGELYHKPKPATATHTFTLGRHIDQGSAEKDSQFLGNVYSLYYGDPEVSQEFTDATSVGLYGPRETIQRDSRISIVGTATAKGNGFIADNKDIKVSASLRINSNYDIESIRPGDTCTVVNVKKDSTTFGENKTITSVKYGADFAEINLETVEVDITDAFIAATQSLI